MVAQHSGERLAPVCMVKEWSDSSCNKSRWNDGSWSSFAFPRGVRYLPVRHFNQELGVSHASIPVTHTQARQDPWQVGLWFYYMRGCSDFLWNVGRTVLYRNRCDAVVELERRARKGTRAEALLRIAHKILNTANVTQNVIVQGYFDAISGGAHLRSASELASALGKCAHGIFSSSEVTHLPPV